MLRRARREASNPDMVEGGLDDFMNKMDLEIPILVIIGMDLTP